MRLDPEIERRTARWAADHHAHITRADAYAIGHTRDTLLRCSATGTLERRTARVFRFAGAPRTPEGELYAAVADGPRGTVASHISAAALFGWRRHPALPHVTVPYGGNTRLTAAVHRSRLDRVDATVVGVIPATTPARTLVDCAAVVAFGSLCEIVDAAFISGRVRRDAVEQAIERASRRPGRRGIPLLREALDIWRPGIERDSVAEARLFRLLIAWGFPAPVTLHAVRDASGQVLCELDAAWPNQLVALEYDSLAHHGPRRWARDERRVSAARALGWTVIPVDKTDLQPGGHQRLRAAIAAALAGSRRPSSS